MENSSMSATSFQPTLPARGATGIHRTGRQERPISTHAPRTGSDPARERIFVQQRNFNPRSPHGERPRKLQKNLRKILFQPTLPARGATPSARSRRPRTKNFNPRSPHGERLEAEVQDAYTKAISTHAPRTGSDDSIIDYQSAGFTISTHAPRTGSDFLLSITSG